MMQNRFDVSKFSIIFSTRLLKFNFRMILQRKSWETFSTNKKFIQNSKILVYIVYPNSFVKP